MGIHLVDLGSLTDPHHVPAAVGTSLGLALKAKDTAAELLDVVRSKRLLIILDSCEHLIDAVASLAERLYQEATQVHVLATSRELLRVEGEHCYRILPLDFPPDSLQTANAMLRYPAVQLFVERRRGERRQFRSHRRRGAVCRRDVPKTGWCPARNRIGRRPSGRAGHQEYRRQPGIAAGSAETGPNGRQSPDTGRSRRRWIGATICCRTSKRLSSGELLLSSVISPWRPRNMSPANSAQAMAGFLTRSPVWSRSRC